MQKSLVTALPRRVSRASKWRFSTLVSLKNMPITVSRTAYRVGVKLLPSAKHGKRFQSDMPEQKQNLTVPSQTPGRPDPIWLRDACSCELCVDPSSKQKRFQTTDIPLEIDYSSKEVGPDKTLLVTWSNDIQGFEDHYSTYSKDFLALYNNDNYRFEDPKHKQSTKRIFWDKAIITESVKFVDFNHYMSEDSVLHDVLEQLRAFGLVFLRNVPESEKAVEDISGRIGPLKNSFYGLTWDVKSLAQAKNIAYTHQDLGLHMDLLYTNSPPGLQLLHCLNNSCEGGVSLFCDSFQAASQLRQENSTAFDRLVNQNISFVYDNAGESYHRTRKVIALHKDSGIRSVSWSPPFQAPFRRTHRSSNFRSFIEALKELGARIEAPENVYKYKLEKGECVIFDNKRVLHGRTAFDIGSGERWLKGAYMNLDDWSSRYEVLHRIFGPAAAISEPS